MAHEGALTTDHVPAQLLYTEFLDSVERHNEADRNFRSLFCDTSTRKSVEIRERSGIMQRMGADTTVPDMQHIDRVTITLPEPTRYGMSGSITREAFERGISSDELRELNAEALDTDARLVTEVVIHEALTDGGWYDATMTQAPPRFKSNVFLTTHDHYLAWNVAGVPLLAHFTAMKRHIQEHGYLRDIICFINGEQAEQIENLTEWGTAPGPMPTPVMDRLQELGFTPSFRAAGVPLYAEDWVPDNYALMVSLQLKPMLWRIPEGPGSGDLVVYTGDPNAQYVFIDEYVRYASCRISRRGAGVAAYFGAAAWTDATTFENNIP